MAIQHGGSGRPPAAATDALSDAPRPNPPTPHAGRVPVGPDPAIGNGMPDDPRTTLPVVALGAERRLRLRQRVRDGFYDSPAVLGALALALLRSGDLC
jgi:hypothetical protein